MMRDADENVVPFPGEPPEQQPPGTQLLAGIVIVMQGLVQIAGIAAGATIMLLAAIGAMTLLHSFGFYY